MRILFCSQRPVAQDYGETRVQVAIAETMRGLGWETTMLGSDDFARDAEKHGASAAPTYAENLHTYLKRHSDEFDVIEYDHGHLPYPRSDFSPRTLLVARSVLLTPLLEVVRIPRARGLKALAGRIVNGPRRAKELRQHIEEAVITLREADLINVPNHDDVTDLVRRGLDPNRITVIPFGLTEARHKLFDAVSSTPPANPMVAFVGTFDYRKGATDFPHIVRAISAAVPNVRFRLLGTKALFQTKEQVLAFFPRADAARIEVIPRFKPEELPTLLSTCSMGIFPSYLEGLPLGILEMLAASLPVVAYNAPGAPMLLSSDFMVPPGDVQALSQKVIALLLDPQKLASARSAARQRSLEFTWKKVALETDVAYTNALNSLRSKIKI